MQLGSLSSQRPLVKALSPKSSSFGPVIPDFSKLATPAKAPTYTPSHSATQVLGTPVTAPSAARPTTTPAASASSNPTDTSSSGSEQQKSSQPNPSAYDLSTDPIVQKIRALNTQDYGTAIANADAARKQALIGSGFGDLANSAQFGSLENPTTGDAATALAAGQNPYSTAAKLALAHTQAQQGIDQNTNAANLFYSSTRANELGDEAHSYLGNVSDAHDAVRQQLSTILQGLLTSRSSEQQKEASGIETARQNAITNAIASGQVLVGYDKDGNPIFGSAPKADTGGSGAGTGTTPGVAPTVAQVGDQAAALANPGQTDALKKALLYGYALAGHTPS